MTDFKTKTYHCEICKTDVNYFSKSAHLKSIGHLKLVNLLPNTQPELHPIETATIPVVPKRIYSDAGTLSIKETKMIFDDSKYKNKYVFKLTNRQMENLKIIEATVHEPFGTHTNKPSYTENDFGNQLKVSYGKSGLEKGTYDLLVNLTRWTCGEDCGICYKILTQTRVPDKEYSPRVSLGCLI